MNDKISIVGNIFGASGYANHIKQLANALHEQGVDVQLMSPKQQGWEALVNDSELLMLTKPYDESRTTIFVDLPPRWPFEIAKNPSKFIGFLVWEGMYIPKYWLKYMEDERVNKIFVPSQHVLDACRRSGYVKNNIHIIPHGVDLSLFTLQEKYEEDQDSFVFVANKGWAHGDKDRGGIQHLIKAYVKEFCNGENVKLRIKINPAYLQQGWNLKNELEKIGLINIQNPKIYVTTMQWYLKDMPKTYRGDVFISTTMADGFNLPGLEAKACGLATIQTGFGGQTDYMSSNCDIAINYSLIDVSLWDLMHEGNQWALPSEDDIRKKMRWAFENKDKIKEMGKIAQLDAQKWSWRNSAKKIIEVLNQN